MHTFQCAHCNQPAFSAARQTIDESCPNCQGGTLLYLGEHTNLIVKGEDLLTHPDPDEQNL